MDNLDNIAVDTALRSLNVIKHSPHSKEVLVDIFQLEGALCHLKESLTRDAALSSGSAHPALAKRIREILSLLRVHDVCSEQKVRIGGGLDGGYVMLRPSNSTTAVLSLGVGGDVSWDFDIAQTGLKVFQFDHTVTQAPMAHDNFVFFQYGAGRDIRGNDLHLTLTEIIRDTGCENDHNLILKFDIEDSEWRLILDETPETFMKFSQIVGEFHGLLRAGDEFYSDLFYDAFSLLKQTHEVVHVHANNWGQLGIIANVPVPDVLEITFARKKDYDFTPYSGLLPTALDRPCHPERADIFLGSFTFGD